MLELLSVQEIEIAFASDVGAFAFRSPLHPHYRATIILSVVLP